MPAPLTEAAIEKVRRLIVDGGLRPGDRLPAEQELGVQLGLSRTSAREAVRALVNARVLDVRRGDGTYVTSLAPGLLLEGIGLAVELMQEDAIMELVEVRLVIEPPVTALAALRADESQRADMHRHLQLMRESTDPAELVRHDTDFHASVAHSAGNRALAALLIGISGGTVRARVWRGLVDSAADRKTVEEHERILAAINDREPKMAEAAATVHVATTLNWLRANLPKSTDHPAGR